jgi:hypothetical protein
MPAEGQLTRLEDVLDSTLEPRANYHAATVQVAGGIVIVIRIEPRRGNPIMVQGYGEYRYYRRRGTRTLEMAASEVAEAHGQADAKEQAFTERLRALPLRARIFRLRSQDELQMSTHPRGVPELPPMATVTVAAMDGPDTLIGADRLALREFSEQRDGKRGPTRDVVPAAAWRLTVLGCECREVDADEDRLVEHLVAIYRGGVIEWARRYEVPGHLPSSTLADDAHDALLYGARVLDEVGYSGRVATWVRVENADKADLSLPSPWHGEVATLTPEFDAINAYRETSTDELLDDPTPTVRHAMDLIWQGFGVNRCFLFDDDGKWTSGD